MKKFVKPHRGVKVAGITKNAAVALCAAVLLNGAPLFAAAENNIPKTVSLGGQSFGVKFFNDGIIVTELEAFYSNGKYVCPAEVGGLQEGDIIKKVNGSPVKNNEELQQATFGCGGDPIKFNIERDGKELVKTVVPKKNTVGVYLLGAWVRDSCAGIGTVTYYDKSTSAFAALGHGICDKDTKELMPLGNAEVVRADIGSVTKSSAGKAGSLNGYFTDTKLGRLTRNTDCGVFGTIDSGIKPDGVTLELAQNGEIKPGKAQLYTTINDEGVGCYEIEITQIRNTDPDSNENFVIKVTDEKLLDECGGIVQGMSGSPIVQDGKLAGAVTHVFLNNTDQGYAITAQNMASNNHD